MAASGNVWSPNESINSIVFQDNHFSFFFAMYMFVCIEKYYSEKELIDFTRTAKFTAQNGS